MNEVYVNPKIETFEERLLLDEMVEKLAGNLDDDVYASERDELNEDELATLPGLSSPQSHGTI